MIELSHVCVAAVLRRSDRVLLCHRRLDRAWYPDVWDLPGGHVEAGERPEQALIRELREELGVVAAVVGTPLASLRDDEAGIDLALSAVDQWEGEIANRAPEEHDELRWVGPEALATLDLAHPAYLELLRVPPASGPGPG